MRAADTTTAPAPDTMARHDTAAAPPVGRASPMKKPASKPAAHKPTAAAQPTPAESSTAAAPQPADTTATGPAQTDASGPLRDAYHTAPLDTVSQEVYAGWKQFNLNCARCHGEDVQGTTIAPHLIVSLRPDGPINTKELFVQTVCAGRPAKGMPSWCALGLEMDKINQIYSYVKGRSDSKIHPGRPAVKVGG
jgi:mono/diheme cytochrome c family protein